MASSTSVFVTVSIGSSRRLQTGEIALDNSYPAGGYDVKPSGIGRWETCLVTGLGGFVYHWDRATQRLRVFRVGASFSNPLAEVGTGVDCSAATGLSFIAVGG